MALQKVRGRDAAPLIHSSILCYKLGSGYRAGTSPQRICLKKPVAVTII